MRVNHFWLAAPVLVLVACTLNGCRRTVDYELPYSGNRLVINGLISPQRVASVNISRSNAPSGEAPPDLFVTDAAVLLYEDQRLVEGLIHRQKGLYISPSGFRPQVGRTYFLRVTAPGLPSAETMPVVVPGAVPLKSYSYNAELQSYLNPSKPAAEVEIILNDSAQTTDYYQIEIAGLYNNQTLVPTLWLPGEAEEAGQPCTLLTIGKVIYQDGCFNGSAFTSIIGAQINGFITSTSNDRALEEVKYQKLNVRLQRISVDYYRYLENADLSEGIQLAFFEPNFLRSNIKDGYGIWGAANEIEINIPLR